MKWSNYFKNKFSKHNDQVRNFNLPEELRLPQRTTRDTYSPLNRTITIASCILSRARLVKLGPLSDTAKWNNFRPDIKFRTHKKSIEIASNMCRRTNNSLLTAYSKLDLKNFLSGDERREGQRSRCINHQLV